MHIVTSSIRILTVVAVAVIVSSICVMSAVAQITIEEDYYRGKFGTSTTLATVEAEDPTSLQGVVDATGEDATYDFTGAAWDTTMSGSSRWEEMPVDFPGADEPRFSSATYAVQIDWEGIGTAEQDSTAWLYQVLNGEGDSFLGFVYLSDFDGDGVKDTLSLSYDPELINWPDPLEYGATWADTASQTVKVGSFQINSTSIVDGEVTGYGELVTPGGSADALRIRLVEKVVSDQDTTVTTTLHFVTEKNLSAYVEIDDDGNPLSASYQTTAETSTDVEARTGELPRRLSLDQNYPNPFNPSTVIPYSVPRSMDVELALYDMLGRRVTVLRSGLHRPGRHEAVLDVSDLSSGVYLYRLTAENRIISRRLTVVK